ncbi:hypothetical protein QBC34DRAFT_394414 [Podospora aff. communis PSN243]|uniref:non-specific serine/threonine protein kinase n=1 Tax=Podospora aff. communis PSN243 TaxID=3040156 RepID=A0AAV9H2A1_9PEZI|nr:hypothetical protein QBC34DRAFT_394414 [Podospora aff. communis PSN243]
MATTENYTIIRNLSYHRVLVKRLSDGESFLGQAWEIEQEPAEDQANLLGHDGPFLAAANVLNHPNLPSFHTEVITSPIAPADTVRTRAMRYLVWDRCDAGTMMNLLADPPVKPVSWGFLPEGLVWHVMIDTLRALQWLHEGIRENYDREEPPEGVVLGEVENMLPDRGWMPILHMAVRPENLFLSQPRGIETYGPCRLGDFSFCRVVPGRWDEGDEYAPPPVVATKDDYVKVGELRELRQTWNEVKKKKGVRAAQEAVFMNRRPFTPGSDVFDLGSILFNMVTGRPLPGVAGRQGQECLICGNNHITTNNDHEYVPGPVNCFPDVNLDTVFLPLAGYTDKLKSVIKEMLLSKWDEGARASMFLGAAFNGYKEWRIKTFAGRLHKDVYDDMWHRKRNVALKEKEDEEAAKEWGVEVPKASEKGEKRKKKGVRFAADPPPKGAPFERPFPPTPGPTSSARQSSDDTPEITVTGAEDSEDAPGYSYKSSPPNVNVGSSGLASESVPEEEDYVPPENLEELQYDGGSYGIL